MTAKRMGHRQIIDFGAVGGGMFHPRSACWFGAMLTCIATSLVRADYLPVFGGPEFLTGQTGAKYDSLFSTAINLSSSGTVVSAYHVFGAAGVSLGWTPVRWSPTSSSQVLGGLYTGSDLPLGLNSTFGTDASGNVYGISTPVFDSNLSGKDQHYQPVRWNANSTTPIALGNLGPNPSGTIIGGVLSANSGGSLAGIVTKPTVNGYVPVRWDASGNPIELGTFSGTNAASFTYSAMKMNDAGVLIGTEFAADLLGNSGSLRALRWDAGSTTPTDLGDGFTMVGINQSGTTIGNSPSMAGRWTAGATQATPLLNLDSVTTSVFARGLNDNGIVIGTSNGHALRWSPDSTIPTELGLIQGAASASALAITNGGLIAGTSNVGGKTHAVYWGADNVAVDLNSLIDPNSGWVLNTPAAINDAGWITGLGTFDPDGVGGQASYQRVFLIQLPEPSFSFLLGLAPLCARRRRY